MRGKSLVEVALAFGLMVLLVLCYKATELLQVEKSAFGLSYFGVVQILIPVAILILARRSFRSYGITLERWRYNLSVGLTCFVVLLIPFMPLYFLPALGTSYVEPLGALLLSGFYAVAILVIALLLRRGERKSRGELASADMSRTVKWKVRGDLVLIGVLLAAPIILSLYIRGPANFNTAIVHSVIFQFFISGFGEEIMFRGYVQSRVNQEFGRPYKFLGIEFGVGLFVAAFLFGLLHVLGSFSPFTGSFGILPWYGVWTFFGGIFLGLVREKTGSILAAGIAHGLPDAFGESLMVLANSV